MEAILMMGKKDGQMQIMIVDMDALIPENHLLKRDCNRRICYKLCELY